MLEWVGGGSSLRLGSRQLHVVWLLSLWSVNLCPAPVVSSGQCPAEWTKPASLTSVSFINGHIMGH